MVGKSISEETEEKLVNFGALGYPAQKMANVLGWDLKEVQKLMDDKKSDFYLLYQRGADLADYLLDKKLFEMAKAGDLKALEKYEIRKRLKRT